MYNQDNKPFNNKFTKPEQSIPLTEIQVKRLNEQKIKLFISQTDEPIPDIVNQPQQTIFSHFRFYFNDSELVILCKDQVGDTVSALHQSKFQQDINFMFQQWKQKGFAQEKKLQKVTHENFIAFVEFWIRSSSNLIVQYSVYDQLIAQTVDSIINNSIYQVAFSISSDQRPFKLKELPKKLKPSKKVELCHSFEESLTQKRLHVYFIHFSKTQGHSSGAIYSKNNKTFDEIGKSYSTINMQQWVCFIKSFEFDKMFEEKYITQVKDLKKKNTRNYLPVKNVKWNSSLHYFKNLFEKFCDSSKQIPFQSFIKILVKLFDDIFSNQAQISKTTTNNNKDPIKEQQTVKNTISLTPQQQGISHLQINDPSKFNQILRSLGIFIPENSTRIGQASRKKQYEKVKPKYLGIPQLGALSQAKLQNGKENNNLNEQPNKRVILPSINSSNVKLTTKKLIPQKEKRFFTLEQLMKQPCQNFNQNKTSVLQPQQKHLDPQIKTKTQKSLNKTNTKNVSQFANEKSISRNVRPNIEKNQHKIINQVTQANQSFVKEDNDGDQFLSQYFRKKQYTLDKTYEDIDCKSVSNGSQNVGHFQRGNGYGNSINFLKRIDQRIDKVQRKLL